MTKVISW